MTRKPAETVSQTLQRARVKIQAGWCQGRSQRRVGTRDQYCLIGALYAVDQHGRQFDLVGLARAFNIAAARLGLPGRQPKHPRALTGWLVTYNDTPGRTKREILALLDAALEEVTK